MNILVTGVGSLLGQGIIKSLKRSKLNYSLYGTDYFNTAIGLYWVKKGFILPDILKKEIDEKIWLEKFINIIIENQIQIILPGLDFEIPLFSKYKKYIESKTKAILLVSDIDVVEICNDKWKTVSFLKNKGIDIPYTVLPNDKDEIIKKIGYPFIVKPRFGHTSKEVFLVNNIEELNYSLNNCTNPIIQEYLEKKELEYTCGTTYYKNKILSLISLRRTLKNGNTNIAYSENCREIDEYVNSITKIFKPYGPFNIQLRMTDQGPRIFEINPRFSGTTPVRAIFGINEVEIIINAIMYNKYNKTEPKILGVVMKHFDNQFISLDEYQKVKK